MQIGISSESDLMGREQEPEIDQTDCQICDLQEDSAQFSVSAFCYIEPF